MAQGGFFFISFCFFGRVRKAVAFEYRRLAAVRNGLGNEKRIWDVMIDLTIMKKTFMFLSFFWFYFVVYMICTWI